MIQANTEIGSGMYSVIIEVPEQLKPITYIVLTHELYQIFKVIDKINPDIIANAMQMITDDLRKEGRNEQN